jgi:hypothetical protein
MKRQNKYTYSELNIHIFLYINLKSSLKKNYILLLRTLNSKKYSAVKTSYQYHHNPKK